MSVDVVTTTAGLAALEPEWVALETAASDTPYYARHHVVRAWWEAYSTAPGHELRVLTVREGGDLVGVAPLALTPGRARGEPVVRLRFASHGDYLGFVLHPDVRVAHRAAKQLMAAVQHDDGWTAVSLGSVPAESALAAHLLRSPEYNPRFTLHVESPVIDLGAHESFEAYEAAQDLGRVRQKAAKFGREVEHTFEVVRGDPQGDLLARMGRLHIREKDHLQGERGRTERHSLFEDPRRVRHYEGIYADPARTVTFTYASPQGDLLAYRSAYVDGTTLLSWNSAYAPELAHYRLSTVLQHDLMRHLFETREFDRFDFGAGRYAWKFTWTPHLRSTYRLVLRRP